MKRLLLALTMMASPASGADAEPVVIPHESLQLAGLMYLPEDKGPFPAIVLLHGCSGMWRRGGEPHRTYDAWARHFNAHGYAALLVDSFGPRGEKEICSKESVRSIPCGSAWAMRGPP